MISSENMLIMLKSTKRAESRYDDVILEEFSGQITNYPCCDVKRERKR